MLPEIGDRGQKTLAETRMLVVGCGALGTAIAQTIARAGVGDITIVDRDVVELSNLARQVLFDEEDAGGAMPKAIAAAEKLRRINSEIQVDGVVTDVTSVNVELLVTAADVVLDGTDNLETRYLINDACVKHSVPWIYGGSVATGGVVMPIVPGESACFRCVFRNPPAPGTLPTCDTAGVLGSAPLVTGALQATEAIKIVLGDKSTVGRITQFNVWKGTYGGVAATRDEECPACGKGDLEFLNAKRTAWVTNLCGRNAVQISPGSAGKLDLENLADSLASMCETNYNGVTLVIQTPEKAELIIFPDGRAIVKGTTDQARARTLYSKYLGD